MKLYSTSVRVEGASSTRNEMTSDCSESHERSCSVKSPSPDHRSRSIIVDADMQDRSYLVLKTMNMPTVTDAQNQQRISAAWLDNIRAANCLPPLTSLAIHWRPKEWPPHASRLQPTPGCQYDVLGHDQQRYLGSPHKLIARELIRCPREIGETLHPG